MNINNNFNLSYRTNFLKRLKKKLFKRIRRQRIKLKKSPIGPKIKRKNIYRNLSVRDHNHFMVLIYPPKRKYSASIMSTTSPALLSYLWERKLVKLLFKIIKKKYPKIIYREKILDFLVEYKRTATLVPKRIYRKNLRRYAKRPLKLERKFDKLKNIKHFIPFTRSINAPVFSFNNQSFTYKINHALNKEHAKIYNKIIDTSFLFFEYFILFLKLKNLKDILYKQALLRKSRAFLNCSRKRNRSLQKRKIYLINSRKRRYSYNKPKLKNMLQENSIRHYLKNIYDVKVNFKKRKQNMYDKLKEIIMTHIGLKNVRKKQYETRTRSFVKTQFSFNDLSTLLSYKFLTSKYRRRDHLLGKIILSKKTNLQNGPTKVIYNRIIKRTMHTEANANALQDINNYIYNSIEKFHRFSEIIYNSELALGYSIHPDLFISAINDLLIEEKNGSFEIRPILKTLDDIQLYDYSGGTPVINAAGLKYYHDILADINGLVAHYPMENTYVSLPVPETPENISTHSDTSSHASSYTSLYDDENNTAIILYTLVAFFAINMVAWYVRTYHQETIKSPEENHDTEDTILNSVFEPLPALNFYTKIISVLFPTFVMLYTFRKYYYNLWTLLYKRKL